MKVGDTVYYFENAASGVEHPGIVMAIHSPFLINICVRIGGQWLDKTSIHHKDCERVRNNPTIARDCGVWGFRDEDEDLALISEMENPHKARRSEAVPAKV